MPLFYVTQDEGYSSVYKPENSFIKDQFSEMVRFAFNLPEKNSYNVKKSRVDSKNKLESLDSIVSDKKIKLAVLVDSISTNRKVVDIENEISKIQESLDRVDNVDLTSDDSITAIVQIIAARKKRTREVLGELNIVRNRRLGLTEIKADIETEANTLSLNEEARRVFMSFGDICSSNSCQLFSNSSDLYAKNLLYLKDQIKDLESNDRNDELREVKLLKEIQVLDDMVIELQDEKEKLIEKSVTSNDMSVVSEIKLEMFKLHTELVDAKKIELTELSYVDVLNKREVALNAYEAYSTGGKVDLRLTGFKKVLRKTFIEWLGELKTSNISYDISLKNDFEPILGDESVNQLSGSTGSRTVLAFHAALLEIAAERSPFNFLILDAPKQHETENIDLDRYMSRLKTICIKHGLQIVFSATEYEYNGDAQDVTWTPSYLVDDKLMFMRKSLN
jgi:hypothetical protein